MSFDPFQIGDVPVGGPVPATTVPAADPTTRSPSGEPFPGIAPQAPNNALQSTTTTAVAPPRPADPPPAPRPAPGTPGLPVAPGPAAPGAPSSGNGIGGSIRLLGRSVSVGDRAVLDASGTLGGGEILVGGDWQGLNPDIVNAQFTYVAATARLSVNAQRSLGFNRINH